ncbi:MAG: hypothetical protein KF861_16290 [Planctomycetaceae bacterium]|nr:hypothetical protein [Planctomycetaceae bacterium]
MMQRFRHWSGPGLAVWAIVAAIAGMGVLPDISIAQDAVAAPAVSAPGGGRAGRSDAEREAAMKAAAAAAGGNPQPDANKPKEGDAAKPEEKKDGESAEPAVVKRPDKWEGPSTGDQLPRQIGPDGLVHFNVQGVPWPELLQWLAEVSQLSLDWQELPGDFPNIRTQRAYNLDEARDVINRHLLARGFTMLKQGELLTVANIKKLNQGLVPRVTPDDLDQHMPHEFVKVSFPLDWMLAKDAAEELKPMLSPNGQLTALTATNRLEAMDAVINLREIRNVLTEEQTGTGQEILVRQFKLQHVRARDILSLVQKVVGIEDYGSVTGDVSDGSARQIMQQLQQIQQMQQQAQRGQASPGPGGKSADDQKPKLVINDRENSIVAHAPPDKMEIIRQTIEALDTPSRREGHLLANPHNFKVHRLSTLDPAPLVSILNELGDLSPETKLQVDNVNKSLIVIGPLVDQITVQTLVEKLDGSTRNFAVIPLRRLRAEDVAGTIMYMLGAQEKKEDNRSSSYYYSYYSSRYSDYSSQKQEDKRPFRVDADIENNRLMLWANEVERREVEDLLVKMGEIPSGQRNNETMRVLDLSTDENADEILNRIRRLWPNIAPNDLQIQNRSQSRQDDGKTPAQAPAASTPATSDNPEVREAPKEEGAAQLIVDQGADVFLARADTNRAWLDLEARASDAIQSVRQFIENAEGNKSSHAAAGLAFNDRTAEDSDRSTSVAAAAPDASRPPIIIQRGADGRLIIGSPDTEALNQLEDLIDEMSPKRRDYVIYKLKHPNTWAFDVEYNLKAFFEQKDGNKSFLDWYGNVVNQKTETGQGLSRRRPLKIIGDETSRTILVQGASPEQLRTIEELIEIYDRPEVSNPQMVRVTQVFTVRYSDAHVVAEAIKEAYRDLLSPNDPAFEKKNGEDKSPGAYTVTYDYGSRFGNNKEDELPERPEPIRFKGALSMGVDDVSNTIVVSAARGLLVDIGELINALDERARHANNIQVVPVTQSINLAALQQRLSPVLKVSRPQPNGNPQGQNPGEAGNNNGNNNNNNNFNPFRP